MQSVGRYKIILIGDGGVGKTSFIKRYIDGSFTKQYIATIGAEVYEINLQISDHHIITFEIWDTAGQEANSGLSDAYYLNAHGAIVFFDLTSRVTLKHVPSWIDKFRNVDMEKKMPICCVGNKADVVRDRKADAEKIRGKVPKGVYYTDMSAKSNYRFEKPLLYMARVLMGDRTLTFKANINVAPAELFMDAEAYAKSVEAMKDVKSATEAPLPEEIEE
ncbi:GTP-binding nuclear protein gsp1/Ran [Gurleya vavrai]